MRSPAERVDPGCERHHTVAPSKRLASEPWRNWMTEPRGDTSDRGIAVVTGGSRGIGRGIVLEAAHRGWDVVLTYRTRAEEADHVVQAVSDLGRRAEAFQVDMADVEAVRSLGAALAERSAVSLLVNNAGVGMEDSLADTKLENWHEAIAINLTAPMLLSQALAERLTQNRG